MRGGYVPCEACLWRQSGIFKTLSASDIAAISRFKKDHIYVPAGRTLVRRDSKQPIFYTLFEGWAYRYTAIDGGRQILHFCLPGDLVAVHAPLTGRVAYSVQTLTDASLCVFECAELEPLFETVPRLGLEIARILASEAALTEIHLATVGRRSAEARVAYLLAELYMRLKQRRMATDHSCTLPLTQEHLADALGLSTVHVSRMLRVLSDDGLAKLDRGRLTILDFPALCDRAEIDDQGALAPPPLL
jgi:CRP-like cAMP-binding protein